MYIKSLILLAFMLFCVSKVHADSIKSYFNYDSQRSYIDPYRQIRRSGDNFEALIVKEIQKAQFSISVAVQELRLPLIAQALVKKHLEGVDVKVILENQYHNTLKMMHAELKADTSQASSNTQSSDEYHVSKYMDFYKFVDINNDNKISNDERGERDAIFILKSFGITIKDDTADFSLGSGLMHHKFIVVDDKTVIASTANFTMSGIHGDYTNYRTRGNPNSLNILESKELASAFQEEFDIMWGESFGYSSFGINKPLRRAKKIRVADSYVIVQFSPVSKKLPYRYSVNGQIAKEIKAAKSEVLMALFVFSAQEIADALKEQYEKRKNFRIGLIVEPKFAYRNYSEVLDIWGVEILDERCKIEPDNNPWNYPFKWAGVSGLTRGDVFHHKFAVIDSKKVIVGSHNWSASANHLNDEYTLFIESKKISKLFREEFYRHKKNARLGVPRSLKRKIERMKLFCRGVKKSKEQ